MRTSDFERFFDYARRDLKDRSDSEKVRVFIEWCRKNNIEETILRLSSEEKGGWVKNHALDFTTTRIIVTRKSFLAKFADLGYVAGLAPFPYLLLLKNPDVSKIKKNVAVSPEELVQRHDFQFFVSYSDVQKLVLRKGIETTIANMFGRAIVSNFLTIKTRDGTYNFTLPVNKNGTYEQIYFWLGVVVPSLVDRN